MCTERYINPFTDFGFKVLFGSPKNKHSMIHILNALLDCEDPITDITYLNPEKLGIGSGSRKAIFDLYCQTESGAHVIVEMQNMHQEFFMDRSIYYSTFPLREAAKKGDWNFNLPAVYTVVFLNFSMEQFRDSTEPRHVVKLCDVMNGRPVYNKLSYVYIEMPKVTKPLDKLESSVDRWLYTIKNMNQLDTYPEELQEEIFRDFFDSAEVHAFSLEERRAYEESLKNMRDWNNILSTAVKEGIEGYRQQVEKEREQERLQNEAERLRMVQQHEQERQRMLQDREQERLNLLKEREQERQRMQKEREQERRGIAQDMLKAGMSKMQVAAFLHIDEKELDGLIG